MTVLVATAAAALVWALSPSLTGHREPWDADGPFYVGALFVAGSVAGSITPRPLWAHYLGAMIGQIGYELVFLRIGPLFLLGAAFLLGYSVIFLAAAVLAGSIRRGLERRPPEVQTPP